MPACSIDLDSPAPGFVQNLLTCSAGQLYGVQIGQPAGAGSEFVASYLCDVISSEQIWMDVGAGGTIHGIAVMGKGTSIQLPNMTTANRPAAPTAGMMVFDTTLNQFIGFNGTIWVVLG